MARRLRARAAAAGVLTVSAPLLAGCGGGSELEGPPGEVASALEGAGYVVDDVPAVSAFEPKPSDSLSVEGNDIPRESLVAVEFADSEDDARALEMQYERIDAPVEVLGAVVISGLAPVEEDQVEAVAEASGL